MHNFDVKPDIVLIGGNTDFRCGINSLSQKLILEFGLNPLDKELFVFTNKCKSSLKMLYWDGKGFWLIQYKPDSGKFKWFKEQTFKSITYKQMEWLLDGLSIEQKNYIPYCDKTDII